ncbi:hypothetical protein H0H87_003890 [Tephrocybe sp. NHM501043]|nr:hypothetical protein H0H87_003890 [Tephrocybe sp. NHM501043]
MAELTFDTLTDDGNYLGSERAKMENKVILDELERKKKARSMAVPTDDNRVKARLREIGEPITLFGERAADRRDRLIYVLSQINAARGDDAMHVDEDSSSESDEEKFANLGSQIGDERPISQVRFAPNNEILATGSWSGTVKLWNVPACTPIRTLRGHDDRVGGVAWHPQATLAQGKGLVNLASGGGEASVCLWSLESDSPISVMKGHQERVCRVAFHPSGNYVASASFDTSWRLWDVNTSKELLLQQGHSKEVYCVDFQSDGALVASGGLDAIGRVWDLRTGRTAMVLDGHVKGIFSIGFSPNGYQIATGAGDDTIRIWDMRSLKSLYTIPAHLSNVSDVRFFHADDIYFKPTPAPASNDVDMDAADADKSHDTPLKDTATLLEEWKYRSGLFFASSGYDGLVKLWSADDWQLLRTLSTDAGKVMSVDISRDGNLLASGTYNRNFQLFAPEDV